MARNNLLYKSLGSGCINLDGTTLESCVLRVVDCDRTDNELLLTDCDKVYMCNRCQTDPIYYMPWVTGMKIMIQTKFVNTVDSTPESPDAGWGSYISAELLDFNFNVIESLYTNISSRYLVGYEGGESYQVIEIDTSLPAFSSLSCFMIRINALDNTGSTYRSVCTQMFRTLGPCEEALELEGQYNYRDCFDNFYGLPEQGAWVGSERFAYRNSLYFRASTIVGNDQIEKTTSGETTTNTTLTAITRLVLHDLLPEYATRIIVRQMLPAPDIRVEDKLFTLPSFTMQNQARSMRYFFFTVDLEDRCFNELRCLPATSTGEPPIIPPSGEFCVDCIEVSCFG